MNEPTHPLAQALLDVLDGVSTDGLAPDELEQRKKELQKLDRRRQYARVDAIEREHFPTLSADELRELGRRIRTEIPKRKSKPAHRPALSKAEHEKDEELAHAIHTVLTSARINFPSGKADEVIGLFLGGVGERSAKDYRKAHARRVASGK